jgi:hypothetical protein
MRGARALDSNSVFFLSLHMASFCRIGGILKSPQIYKYNLELILCLFVFFFFLSGDTVGFELKALYLLGRDTST